MYTSGFPIVNHAKNKFFRNVWSFELKSLLIPSFPSPSPVQGTRPSTMASRARRPMTMFPCGPWHVLVQVDLGLVIRRREARRGTAAAVAGARDPLKESV